MVVVYHLIYIQFLLVILPCLYISCMTCLEFPNLV
ncbi:hypothetical protein LINGRAHAP2_LOCUS22222 [Linum grandiflorum]